MSVQQLLLSAGNRPKLTSCSQLSWSDTMPYSRSWLNPFYVPVWNKYFIYADNYLGSTDTLAHSSDCANWTAFDFVADGRQSDGLEGSGFFIYGKTGAAGDGVPELLLIQPSNFGWQQIHATTTDGLDWSYFDYGEAGTHNKGWGCGAFGGNGPKRYVVLGSPTGTQMTSMATGHEDPTETDPVILAQRFGDNTSSMTAWNGQLPRVVIWSEAHGLFICLLRQSTGTGTIITSPDGITWTQRTTGTVRDYRTMAENSTGRIICMGPGTAKGYVLYSDDGINWSQAVYTASPSRSPSYDTSSVCSAGRAFVALMNAGYSEDFGVSNDGGLTWSCCDMGLTVGGTGVSDMIYGNNRLLHAQSSAPAVHTSSFS